MRRFLTLASASLLLTACSGGDTPPPADSSLAETTAATTTAAAPSPSQSPDAESAAPEATTQSPDADFTTAPGEPVDAPDGAPFSVASHGEFDEPWAMTFLPGTNLLLISEKPGRLLLRDQGTGELREVSGAPEPHVAGQGGLGDVLPAPSFREDGGLYLSWVRGDDRQSGAVVARGTLDVDAAALTDVEIIWEQDPTDGRGHFSHRLAIRDDLLYITSGDRQKFDPAQDLGNNLGTIVRLTLDGEPADGNPFPEAPEVFTFGHRNGLGLEFDANGNLWESEMGPKGGDELNLIRAGMNYGWPEASNGSHYDGADIPNHADGDGFEPPRFGWTPSVSPGSLMIYQGDLFPEWTGDAFLGALSGEALIRVDLEGTDAVGEEQWPMGKRIRAVEEGPDGSIWLLEDKVNGRLLQLTP